MRTPRRPFFLAAAMVCLLSTGLRAGEAAPPNNIGRTIANLTFRGADGKAGSLHELKGKKAIVIVFLSFDCPVSNSYALPLTELHKTFAPQGVAFLGFCPGDETAASVAKHARDYGLPFPMFHDERRSAAGTLRAEITPEAFVLDGAFTLRYRGRIDDGYTARLRPSPRGVQRHDLREALAEVVAGKPVATAVTKAVGCPIYQSIETALTGKVTYHEHVLPILQNHCQICHRPGAVGPFSLLTYAQAVNWASDIKEYTQSKQMPPWKITSGVTFHNERRLTEQELTTLAAWADGGTPEGDPKKTPAPKRFTDGWQIGKPDLILEPKGDFVVGPTGRDLFRCFVLPTALAEDRHVVAIEVKPSNPRVVHHTLNFIDTTGQAQKLEAQGQEKEKGKTDADFDRGPGYSQSMGIGFLPRGALGGWAPGQLARTLPAGYGYLLPKGADVVVQVHYHRDGKVEKDRTQIGLYFAPKGATVKPFRGGVIRGNFLAIPPNRDDYPVTGTTQVVEDCTLHSIMPHMHLVGRSIKVTLRGQDGSKKTLLEIKDWDYNWQETYFLKTPLKLKAGDALDVEAVYDNSTKNPNNPNAPPRIVFFGEQTTNEMCFVFLGATSEGARRSPFANPQRR